jgi:uncharacterized protein YjbJ (UPF0337 family)
MTMLSDDTRRERVSGTWRLPRSRGLAAGIALIVLGCWAGLIPFIGPYFGYAYTPASPWMFTWGRFWLEILPAAAAIAGGLLLVIAANRLATHAGGWLAVVAGGWLLVGPPLSQIWAGGAGHPTGDALSRAVEQIGFFTGLGGVIILVAALAAGRVSVRSVRDVRAAEKRRAARHADDDTEQANDTTETGATAAAESAETVPAGDGAQPAPAPSRTAGQASAGQASAGGAYEVSRDDEHEKDLQRGEPAETRRTAMAKDPNTTIDKFAGKAKKAAGRVSGNDRLRGEGDREQRGAELKDKASQARDKATGAVRRRRQATSEDGHDQPTGGGQRAAQQDGDASASEAGHTFREAGQKAGEALDAARDAFRDK